MLTVIVMNCCILHSCSLLHWLLLCCHHFPSFYPTNFTKWLANLCFILHIIHFILHILQSSWQTCVLIMFLFLRVCNYTMMIIICPSVCYNSSMGIMQQGKSGIASTQQLITGGRTLLAARIHRHSCPRAETLVFFC